MDPEYSRIIGLEVVTDNLFETDAIYVLVLIRHLNLNIAEILFLC